MPSVRLNTQSKVELDPTVWPPANEPIRSERYLSGQAASLAILAAAWNFHRPCLCLIEMHNRLGHTTSSRIWTSCKPDKPTMGLTNIACPMTLLRHVMKASSIVASKTCTEPALAQTS